MSPKIGSLKEFKELKGDSKRLTFNLRPSTATESLLAACFSWMLSEFFGFLVPSLLVSFVSPRVVLSRKRGEKGLSNTD